MRRISNKSLLLGFLLSLVAAGAIAQGKDSVNLYGNGRMANNQNFTGTVWVNMLVESRDSVNCVVGSVRFEPGARTNWHFHPGGQILLVTDGTGYYQEKGQLKRIIRKGDVIVCLPNVEHWHGASSDSAMTHIATVPNANRGPAVWLQKVSNQEYSGKN